METKISSEFNICVNGRVKLTEQQQTFSQKKELGSRKLLWL